MDVLYRYGAVPNESTMRAIDSVREVYGIRKIQFNEKDRTVRVEYDASRMKEPAISSLLRNAGVDLQERVQLV
jgi:hypothetical protein